MILIPRIESAIKCIEIAATASKHSAAELSKSRTAIRKFSEAVKGNIKDVLDLEVEAAHVLGKAVSKGLVSESKTNRNKSRLSKRATNR